VTIYNAGSNTGSFGPITLSGSGSFNLASPATGTYAGVLFFQPSSNTQTVSLTANAAIGLNGTLYAPAAILNINGGGQLKTAAIVNQLKFTGNGGNASTTVSSPLTGSITSGSALAVSNTAGLAGASASTVNPDSLHSSRSGGSLQASHVTFAARLRKLQAMDQFFASLSGA
jgi:hypothetical protein